MFSKYEWNYAQRKHTAQTLTGLWCAKEAVVKAIHLHEHFVQITDVCISHHPNGAPYIKEIKNKDITSYHLSVSISHTKNYATAVCICSKK